MQLKPNRYRKTFATTINPDVHWIIDAFSVKSEQGQKGQKGQFVDEVVSEWLTNCAWFEMPGAGVVRLFNANLYYVFQDPNDEDCSPQFRTFRDAFTWLRTTYPESNRYIDIRS